jgi:tripartite-type tricarboxylate transporter receptor subunit TctC
VSTPKRWPGLPDVPTVAESGVPGYEATLWLNLAAPAGTPPDIIKRLVDETAKALQDPELQKSFQNAGVEATFAGPDAAATYIRGEYEKWGQVVKQTGASVN